MFSWIGKKIKSNTDKIIDAIQNIITNKIIDKITNECYMEIKRITMITKKIHEIISENITISNYQLKILINQIFPEVLISEQEITDIKINKFIGLRLLDYRLIKIFGSDFLNNLDRKNKDFLIEVSIMEDIINNNLI